MLLVDPSSTLIVGGHMTASLALLIVLVKAISMSTSQLTTQLTLWLQMALIPIVLKVRHIVKYFIVSHLIIGTWNGIKIHMYPKSFTKKQIRASLNFFMWRRKHEGKFWKQRLYCLRTVYLLDNTEEENALVYRLFRVYA